MPPGYNPLTGEDLTPVDTGAPVTSPSEVQDAGGSQANTWAAPPTSDQFAPSPELVKQAASVYTKGITPEGQRLAGGAYARANQQADKEIADQEVVRAGDERALRGGIGEQRAAIRQGADAETVHFQILQSLERESQAFQMAQARLETNAQAESKASAAKYIGAYQEQLAGVRALAATTGNPLGGLSGMEKTGLGFAQFAQGFLAARGIHIDVNSQIDRWVDRGIQEHQQAIQNARQDAGDSLHLYEIARQTSQDDWEARQRYRGFVIEGFKSQLQSEAARFGSDIANSRAAEQMAQADVALAQTVGQLHDRRFGQDLQIRMQHINQAHMENEDANQSARLRIDQMLAQAKLKEAENKGPLKPIKISDPGATERDANGKIIGAKNMWSSDPDASKEEQQAGTKKVTEAAAEYDGIQRSLARLKELRAPAMAEFSTKYGPTDGAKKFTEAYRAYDRQKKLSIFEARHAIAGSNLTKEERQEWDSLLDNDSIFEQGSNAGAVEQLETHYRDKFLSVANHTAGVRPLALADQDTAPIADAANDTEAAYNARFHAGPGKTTPISEEEGKIDEKGSGDTYQGAPSSMWVNHQPDSQKTPGAISGNYEQPAWAVVIDHIAHHAVDPEGASLTSGLHNIGGKGDQHETPEQIRQDALDALDRTVRGENGDGERQEYAKKWRTFVREAIKSKDPTRVRSLLGPMPTDAEAEPQVAKQYEAE